jgi:predicted Zn-dependent protease
MTGRAVRPVIAVVLFWSAVLAAQTVITPPKNAYPVSDDVKLGKEAAAQVEKDLPILRDKDVTSFVAGIGQRLVASIPNGLRHSEFHYSFQVVNVSDINAFALPGGPMFVNRGMIQAAAAEDEVAGVMAHELSHVVLRHATAEQTKEQPFALGALAGAVAGALIGGRAGQIVSQGTQLGLGTYVLRYSREYEKQADLMGVQIMARTGYDPRALAHMFKTIEERSGSGGLEFLSDHPNPGNRQDYIIEEASHVQVRGHAGDARKFARVQDKLRRMPAAPTTADLEKANR